MSRNLDCPKCDVFLKRFELGPDLVIDRCPQCEGVWLDQGELAALTSVPDEVFRWKFALESGSMANIQCPACRTEKFKTLLKEVKFGFKEHKLLIDLCPQCSGMWLDTGELAAFQEMVRMLRIEARK